MTTVIQPADYHLDWADGDRLIGKPVVNDRGLMPVFVVAAEAISDAGVRLDDSSYRWKRGDSPAHFTGDHQKKG